MNKFMDYSLSSKQARNKRSFRSAFAKMFPLLKVERRQIIIAFIAVLSNSGFNLLGPLIVGYTIDNYILEKNYHGVLIASGFLLAVYIVAFVANYIQMRVMGGVAQRMLWKLRNDVFAKLQELPLAFFNQNKAGDLISRINNDTDKLNQFFSQGLMRFAGNIFLIIGAGIFVISINWKLGIASLIPGIFIFLFTRFMASWVRRVNTQSLSATGLLSAEIQESIANFKVILAFNRRDYFKTRFEKINNTTFKSAFKAGIANELFTPVFEFLGNVAQLIVLGFGIYLIIHGQFAVGLLVSFVLYVTRFYDPLREMARLWAVLQSALAAWDRIGVILHMSSNLEIVSSGDKYNKDTKGKGFIEFRNVSFVYPEGKKVLHKVNFIFEKGKTYALVGPTGGGKTTTASLIARLFDPTEGVIFLDGLDIRSYESNVRAQKIGFILQEPFLFTGTLGENIAYGNDLMSNSSRDTIMSVLKDCGLDGLISRFDKGLDTVIYGGGGMSLGERQIIAFIRAVARKPEILILDEATANIDTVTESILEKILDTLPAETTRVIIAHRLNTIAGADDIFFVNGGEVTEAGSMEHAVDMLLHTKVKS